MIQQLHRAVGVSSCKAVATSMFVCFSVDIGSRTFRKSPFSPPTSLFSPRYSYAPPDPPPLFVFFHTSFCLKWTPLGEADSLHYRHSVDYFPHSPFSLKPSPAPIRRCYHHRTTPPPPPPHLPSHTLVHLSSAHSSTPGPTNVLTNIKS